MSIRLNKLLEKRGQIADQMDALLAKAANDNSRDLSDEEKEAFDDLDAELKGIEGKIAFEKRVEDAKAASARPLTPATDPATDQQRVIVPASARHRSGKLKAFKNEEDAYTSGMFLLATIGRSAPGKAHLNSMGERAAKWLLERGIDVVTRSQNEGSSTAGGYLVIPAFEQAIIDLRETYGTFRQHVGVTPMSSDTQSQPVRTGGLTAYWVNEAAQITESEKTWGQVNLTAKKLAALSKFSSELSEDAIISIADDLAREMAYAFAQSEDLAGWDGDGTSTYGGIIGVRTKIITAPYTASVYTPASGLDTFAEITKGDLEGTMGMLPKYVTNPKWYVSQPGYVNMLLRLATAAGGVTATEMVNGVVNYNYYGFPVVIDQTLPKVLTDLSDVAMAFFGDLSLACKMGERRGITISLSDQRYWEYDQIGIRATERVDIVAHSLGSTTVAGPIIALVGE